MREIRELKLPANERWKLNRTVNLCENKTLILSIQQRYKDVVNKSSWADFWTFRFGCKFRGMLLHFQDR